MSRKLTAIQRRALDLIADLGDGAAHPDYVRNNTIRSLRRLGLVTGCFDRLAVTDEGREVMMETGAR